MLEESARVILRAPRGMMEEQDGERNWLGN